MPEMKTAKYVTPVIFGVVAVAAVLIVLRQPEKNDPSIYLKQGVVVIEKPNTTLADVALAVGDPSIFSYDAKERKARANAHVGVFGKGSLHIGTETQGELLEFDTNVCGGASLQIGPDAAVEVLNSEIATTHRTVSAGVCTRGYIVYCDGRITARNSKFHYISGNRSQFFRADAGGVLENVEIRLSDGASLKMVEVDGSRLLFSGCRFETAGKYGLFLSGSTRKPVRIEASTLFGTTADIFLSQGAGELVLVDCRFRRRGISFENSRGSVHVKWRARVKVTRAGRPLAGATVAAEGSGEKVTAQTDSDGLAVMELTEEIIAASGTRQVTPHVFSVTAGNKTLVTSAPLEVNGPADAIGEIVLDAEPGAGGR